MPVCNGVTLLATILVRLAHKLIVVRIFVAVRAQLEFHFIDGVFACGDVALGAFDLYMFALQRVLRGVVFFHAESGRLPAVYGVALGTFAFLRPRIKLALVRIRRMAILAIREGNLFFEVILDMASGASDGDVLAGQRILGLGVIEVVAGK